MSTLDEVTTRECPACHAVAPAGSFCGDCGAQTGGSTGAWTALLRPKVYANAPREPIWLSRISSTLFPRLPGPMRKPFRVGLFFVLIAVVVFAALRLNGPVGVVATIGGPLLFLLYTWETDVFRDIPLRILALAMALGIGIGVSWWTLTATLLAGSYGVSTGSGLLLLEVLNFAFLLTVGGAVLMLLSIVITRVIRMPVRESLDGFVVGAFGALAYATATTTTIVAPQFVEGLTNEHSAARMLQVAIRNGVVNPIITVAVGGLLGLTLWFRPHRRPGREPRRARTALTMCTILAAGFYVAVWAVDGLAIPVAVDLLLKLGLAVLALLTVRCAVQIALLHEEPDPSSGEPVLCVHCERVVPDMPFCSACGAAARASSRSSRRTRRECPPVPDFVDN